MPKFGEIITNRFTIQGSVSENISDEMKENLKELNILTETSQLEIFWD